MAASKNTLLQDPYRNNCGKFGDKTYSGSEKECENVKSLPQTY
jgi:hypothetical protein